MLEPGRVLDSSTHALQATENSGRKAASSSCFWARASPISIAAASYRCLLRARAYQNADRVNVSRCTGAREQVGSPSAPARGFAVTGRRSLGSLQPCGRRGVRRTVRPSRSGRRTGGPDARERSSRSSAVQAIVVGPACARGAQKTAENRFQHSRTVAAPQSRRSSIACLQKRRLRWFRKGPAFIPTVSHPDCLV